jgi:predicted phosphatase
MDQVTDILIYFNNHTQTITEAEWEYKYKQLEKLKAIGEDEIYNLLMKELNKATY